MDNRLLRSCVLEFVATFGLVYFAAGVVCVNQLATPLGQQPSQSALTAQQPGLVGIALVYGLTVAALFLLGEKWKGGYANPALTLTLWVYSRLETRRMLGLVAVQLAASLLAAGVLRLSFDESILRSIHMATPHLNSQAYPDLQRLTLATGCGIELILTFFLALAIFGAAREGAQAAIAAGAVVTASVLVAYPLTGAALNPARWFGLCCFEAQLGGVSRSAWVDTVVYVAGPILGGLLAGLVSFKLVGDTDRSPTP